MLRLEIYWKNCSRWMRKPHHNFRFHRSRRLQVIVLLFIAIFISYIYWWQVPEPQDQKEIFIEVQNRLKELVAREKGTGCKMPYLDPFSLEATKFDKDVETVACDADGGDWVECHFAECSVTNRILRQMVDIACIYKDIVFVNDDKYYLGDAVKLYGVEKYILNASDYVRVSCTATLIGSRVLMKSRWYGYKAGYRPVKHQVVPPENSINIFMLLIDSASRNHFIRRMPLSYKMLKDELRAVIMENYNIVGDGTARALYPILTGHNDFEMDDYRKTPKNTRRVDPKPFLFTFLKERGYRTAYYEDMPYIGTFTYGYNGFENMPTDHYMRVLFQESDWYSGLWWTGSKRRYCFGSQLQFKFMVDHSADLFKMSGKKFCLTFSVTYSHEFDANTISLLDKELEQFLYKFKNDGHLNNTLLFMMSDHGPRFTYLRNTNQGKIEQFLPFVSVVLPESLKKARPDALDNLRVNSKVLTTPFDVHTTILDAFGLKELRNKYKVPGSELERGMSFLEPIPATRSCSEAGVLTNWCACAKWHNVSSDEVVYTKVAWELARFINRITESERDKCAERHLISIEWVYRQNITVTSEAYYQAKIIMDPGEAIFEGYLHYIEIKHAFFVNDWDVVRVNKYGNEPKCITQTNPHLNKYCYCNN